VEGAEGDAEIEGTEDGPRSEKKRAESVRGSFFAFEDSWEAFKDRGGVLEVPSSGSGVGELVLLAHFFLSEVF